MFSDTAFWRLIWKEYRTQRPLWLTLLILAPLLQVALLGLTWMMDGPQFQLIRPDLVLGFFAISYLASTIYLLGSGATMFAVEHETGTFDFQRGLPADQARVFWAKVGFALVSSAILTLILWIVTRGVFGPEPLSQMGVGWFSGLGALYMTELFAWSVLSSVLIRQPLWAVIAAVTAQSVMHSLVLLPLKHANGSYDLSPFVENDRLLACRIGLLLILMIADIVLGKLWFEDRLRLPRWQLRWKPDFAPSYASTVELPPYIGQRQVGWQRLLWLSWRDGRWVMAGFLAWYGYIFLTIRIPNDWSVLAMISFHGCFAFGLFAFAPEQWGGRFRFLTERGCSPRKAWLCRQAIWLPPILVMWIGTIWKLSLARSYEFQAQEAAINAMMATVIPLLCYSAGQLAAMLCRSTVMAIAVGIGMCLAGGMWGALMTSWLAPTWWSVGALPVIGLFVTWLRANDWIEERRDRVARWRLALGLGVPIVLLLATCATYRVMQIPVVTLPAEWGEDGQPKKLTAAESETLDLYRRALAEIEAGNKRVSSYDSRVTRIRQEHADWSDAQVHTAAFNGFHKDWLAEQSAVVPLLREAHSHVPVPLALLQPDLTGIEDRDWMSDKTAQFSWLMVKHARETLEAGRLDVAWQEIEVTFELIRRYRLRASPANAVRQVDFNERMLQEVIADWGRHPDQSRDRVVAALRRYEQLCAAQGAVLHSIHWNMLLARITLSSDERSREIIAKTVHPGIQEIEKSWTWKVWKWLPWERWRSERVLRLAACLAVRQAESRLHPWGPNQSMPANDMIGIGINPNSAEWVYVHTTLLPPDLTYGLSTGIEQLDRIAANRVTLLRLALADWHREHGSYPESLSQLAPTYFTVIPFDPRAAGPFVYFPHGVSDNVTQEPDNQGRVILEKGIPFLLTMGAGNAIAGSGQLPDGSWAFADRNGKPISLSDALRSARVWPLEKRSASNQ